MIPAEGVGGPGLNFRNCPVFLALILLALARKCFPESGPGLLAFLHAWGPVLLQGKVQRTLLRHFNSGSKGFAVPLHLRWCCGGAGSCLFVAPPPPPPDAPPSLNPLLLPLPPPPLCLWCSIPSPAGQASQGLNDGCPAILPCRVEMVQDGAREAVGGRGGGGGEVNVRGQGSV